MLFTLTAIKTNDKTRSQKTRRNYWLNETEAAELEPRLQAEGYRTERIYEAK